MARHPLIQRKWLRLFVPRLLELRPEADFTTTP